MNKFIHLHCVGFQTNTRHNRCIVITLPFCDGSGKCSRVPRSLIALLIGLLPNTEITLNVQSCSVIILVALLFYHNCLTVDFS